MGHRPGLRDGAVGVVQGDRGAVGRPAALRLEGGGGALGGPDHVRPVGKVARMLGCELVGAGLRQLVGLKRPRLRLGAVGGVQLGPRPVGGLARG